MNEKELGEARARIVATSCDVSSRSDDDIRQMVNTRSHLGSHSSGAGARKARRRAAVLTSVMSSATSSCGTRGLPIDRFCEVGEV